MSEIVKNPKIIYYGAEQKKTVGKIDQIGFLGLQNTGGKDIGTPRIDLFLFAMALGMETVPTEVKQPDTFIRDEYVKNKHDSLLYAAFIHNLKNKEDIDSITNKEQVYKLAQNYANTGFDLIKDMMENRTETVAELELIKELDEQYEKYFGE